MNLIEEHQQTVLVAEDSPDDLFFLQRALEQAKCDICFRYVKDGEEAIAYLQGEPPYTDREAYPFPSLLLLDLGMPKVDGFAVLKWIRSTPACEGLEVFVVTGHDDPPHVARAIKAGADKVISKGMEAHELRSALELLGGMVGGRGKSDRASAGQGFRGSEVAFQGFGFWYRAPSRRCCW